MSNSLPVINLRAHRLDPSGEVRPHDANVNDLLRLRENRFFDWSCWAGVESLMIDAEGNVYRASCRVGGKLGNIHTGFDLPEQPIRCSREWCVCAADLNTTKVKSPGFQKYVGAAEQAEL